MPIQLPDDCTRLLDAQHGVIARWQAPAVNLCRAVIDGQLRSGRWRPLYRGVYATYTGAPPRASILWAAVLRAGPGAVLSHHTAAELDGLTDRPSGVIHVTVGHDRRLRAFGRRHDRAPRIVLHRSDRLDEIRHPTRRPPRTRVEETILDLTQLSTGFDDAFGWLCAGCGRRLTTPQLIREAISRRSRVRWRGEILGTLPLIADGVHSNLEYRYVRDVEHAHRLPKARRQAGLRQGSPLLRSQYLDNLYESYGVAVELDGRAHHPAESRWRDIHRDNVSARLGITTLRYNWADVTRRPCEVAADVSDALRQRGWPGHPRPCGPHCPLRHASGELFQSIALKKLPAD